MKAVGEMVKKEMRLVEREFVTDVYCDICKKRIHTEFDKLHEDYIHIDKKWGYGSKNDGKECAYDICEDCWSKIESLMKK